MSVSLWHKVGKYTVELDSVDQGRLAEIKHYYSISQNDAMNAILNRGLASILIQVRQEKAQSKRVSESRPLRPGEG